MMSKLPPLNLRSALAQGLALSAVSACAGAPVFTFEEAEGSGGASAQGSGGALATGSGGSSSGGTTVVVTGGLGGNQQGLGGSQICELEFNLSPRVDVSGYWSDEEQDCCLIQSCVPVDETGQCPALESPWFVISSFTCHRECGAGRGPLMPNFDIPMSGEGECCYVLGYEPEDVCVEGRPLRQDDTVIVAPVIARHDWMMS